jgi:hypothetical protein
MNKINIITVILFCAAITASCTNNNTKKETVLKKVDTVWLDSVMKNSDSTYSKKYRTVDFATADYYWFDKDSSVCQVMKDTANIIRQILISRKNTRTYFAQYYNNGQLIADVKLDNFGQPDGIALYYYHNGSIMRTGKYHHGLAVGEWKEFREDSQVFSIVKYDSNGVRKN